jgi:hypothetical protein
MLLLREAARPGAFEGARQVSRLWRIVSDRPSLALAD